MEIHVLLSQWSVEHMTRGLIMDIYANPNIANFTIPSRRIIPKAVLDVSQD